MIDLFRPYVLPAFVAFSGILTALCGLVPLLWPLIWITPIPFLYALFSPCNTPTRTRALLIGAIFGFALNFTVNAASWSAYPLDWIGIPNPFLSMAIVGTLSTVSSLFMAGGHTLLALVLFELRARGWHTIALVAALLVLWPLAEWLQAFFFSLYVLGPTSTVNAFLQTASIAYIFANSSSGVWMALARWGGMPLLAVFPLVSSAIGALAVDSLSDTRAALRAATGMIAVFLLFVCLSVIAANDAESARGMSPSWGETNKLTVVVATTDFPAQFIQTKEVLDARNEIVFRIARDLQKRHIEPDVFLVPETVGNALGDDGYEKISALLPEGSLLVHGKYEDGEKRIVLTRSHVVGGDTYFTDKQFIMPYGEYPPYHFLAPVSLFAPEVRAGLRAHREYGGGERVEMGSARGVPVGVRICSEIYAPHLYSSLAERGAGLLVQSSSIKIFEGAGLLEWTMRSAARMRAVENGLPIVQATNGGASTAFDCQGRELAPDLVTDTFKVYTIAREAACRR